jgi:hypothetical protein
MMPFQLHVLMRGDFMIFETLIADTWREEVVA